MNHYTILQPYFEIAENYGFGNRTFQTNQGPSFPAHQFLFSGTSAPFGNPNGDNRYQWFAAENVYPKGHVGCASADNKYVPLIDTGKSEGDCKNNPDPQHCYYPCYDHRTMADLLDPLPRLETDPPNWAYYARNADHIFTAPNAIQGICGLPHSSSCSGDDWNHVVLPEQRLDDEGAILSDIEACQLAKVSWVVPDGHWSDHPGDAGSDGGPSWVAAIVNAIGNSYANSNHQCDYWGDQTNDADATAVIVVWDDWGGWYDHVPPLNNGNGYPNGSGSQYVYGFRVPLLVVSRYTPQHVSNVNHDFGSILNFVEYVFGTEGSSIGEVNGNFHFADHWAPDAPPQCSTCVYSLSDFFDFAHPRGFTPIHGAKYLPACFHNAATPACFGTGFADEEPDNDALEDD